MRLRLFAFAGSFHGNYSFLWLINHVIFSTKLSHTKYFFYSVHVVNRHYSSFSLEQFALTVFSHSIYCLEIIRFPSHIKLAIKSGKTTKKWEDQTGLIFYYSVIRKKQWKVIAFLLPVRPTTVNLNIFGALWDHIKNLITKGLSLLLFLRLLRETFLCLQKNQSNWNYCSELCYFVSLLSRGESSSDLENNTSDSFNLYGLGF